MEKHSRAEIKIRSHELLIVRSGQTLPSIKCPACGESVLILTPEQARDYGWSPALHADDPTNCQTETVEKTEEDKNHYA